MSREQSLPINFFYYFDYERMERSILNESSIFELTADVSKFSKLREIYDSNFESEYFEIPTNLSSQSEIERQEYIKGKLNGIMNRFKEDICFNSMSATTGATPPSPPFFSSPFIPGSTIRLGIKKIKLILGSRTEKLTTTGPGSHADNIVISLDCDFSKDLSKINDEKKINTHLKDELLKLKILLERQKDKTIEVYVPMVDRDMFSFSDNDLDKLYKKGNNMLYFKTALNKFISSETLYSEASKYEHPRILDIVYGRSKKLCEEYRKKNFLFEPTFNCTDNLNEFWYVCYFIQQLYKQYVLKKPKLKMITILDVNTKGFKIDFTKIYEEEDNFDYTFLKEKPIINEKSYKYFVVSKKNELQSKQFSDFNLILEEPLTYLAKEVSSNGEPKKLITLEEKLNDPIVFAATVEHENSSNKEKYRGLFAKKDKIMTTETTEIKKSLGIQEFIRSSVEKTELFFYIPGFLFHKEDIEKYQASLKSNQPFYQFLATLLTKKQNLSKFYIFCKNKLKKKYTERDNVQSNKIMKAEINMLLRKNTPFYVKRFENSISEKESEYNVKSYKISECPINDNLCEKWEVAIKLYKKPTSKENTIKGKGCDASKSRVFGSMRSSARGMYIAYLLRTLRGGKRGFKKVKHTRNKKKDKKKNIFKKTKKVYEAL